MAHTVIRKRGNRYYRYLEESYRDKNGNPRKHSVYLGPVDGGVRKRRRGGGLGGLGVGTLIVGAITVAAQIATGRLGPPGGKKPSPVKLHPALRERSVGNAQLRELYAKYQIDDTDQVKFQASFDRLPKEMRDEVEEAREAIFSTYQAARGDTQTKSTSPVERMRAQHMKEYADRVSAQQDRATVQEAIGRAEAISPGVTEDGAAEKGKG